MALLMRGYVPQRHTLLMLLATACSSGLGLLSSNALTAMIMPDWQ
jgi:hypothetical protein